MSNKINAVMIIPTGIGCEIGGHAGDATPAAKLLGACCDKLILHPNVVNASDINEMPPNALYVEGSILDRFLGGEIELREVRQNKILLMVNAPVRSETINAVSAARATIGADIEILELDTPLLMKADMVDGHAAGTESGVTMLLQQFAGYSKSDIDYRGTVDALAIATPIRCEKETALRYFRGCGVNPWGGIEAIVSKIVASSIHKPVAHAPILEDEPELKYFNEVVDPRIAAEVISMCYLHCVLKGLHKAPRIVDRGLSVRDVDALITPIGCVGSPHHSCMKAGIPIIAVKENTCVLNDTIPDEFILVENYVEAAGVLMAMNAGVCIDAVRRPLDYTEIIGN